MNLQFLGATGTVTGSKYLVTSGEGRVLIDCGLFQGWKDLRLRNRAEPDFDVRPLDAVVLTHAHLDHSGYVPLLVKRGYRGPIYCTQATYELCRILLPDSGRLQEEDAERANRKGYSRHAPALPLYTEADAVQSLEQFQTRPFHERFEVAPGIGAWLAPAGHILGSAMVRVDDGATSVLFSGDLGRPSDLIMRAPEPPPPADYVVVESTYGDRRHDPGDPVAELGQVIQRVAARRGVVVIPSFAVGRTQTLLWCLQRLKEQGLMQARIPIYLNSPMAIDATAIFKRHADEHRLTPAECQRMFRVARYVNTVDESRALNLKRGPMVIVAGSGMATGGRVIHHIKAFAADPRNAIVFAGFQAAGTRGAALLGGANSTKIHGEYVAVRAEVCALNMLSAHADYAEILSWLAHLPRAPRGVFITHGEAGAAQALLGHIDTRFGWTVSVPEYRDTVRLG